MDRKEIIEPVEGGMQVSQATKSQIINFAESAKHESRTTAAPCKLTASQNMALESLSRETGTSKSKLISNSVEFYLTFFEQSVKMQNESEFILSLIERLR